VLRLAPVTSHVALAAARAALDAHLPDQWRVQSWEGGVLDVVVWASNTGMMQAASEIARSTSFACWPVTSSGRPGAHGEATEPPNGANGANGGHGSSGLTVMDAPPAITSLPESA
jgi:hypothetical protein